MWGRIYLGRDHYFQYIFANSADLPNKSGHKGAFAVSDIAKKKLVALRLGLFPTLNHVVQRDYKSQISDHRSGAQ